MPTTIADAFGKATLHDGFVKSAMHERDPKPASALTGWSKTLIRNTIYGWRSFVSTADTASGNYSRVWARLYLKQEYTHPTAGYQFHQKECVYGDFANIENGFAPNVFGHRYLVENETKSAGFDANTGTQSPFLQDQQLELTNTRHVLRRWRRAGSGGLDFALDTTQELRGDTIRMYDLARDWNEASNGTVGTAATLPPNITASPNVTRWLAWGPLGNLYQQAQQQNEVDNSICPGYQYDINTAGQLVSIGISIPVNSGVYHQLRWRAINLRTSGGIVNRGRVNTTQLGSGQFSVTEGPTLLAAGSGADEVIYPPRPVLSDFGKQLHRTESSSSWFDVVAFTPVTFPSFVSVVPNP